MWIAQPPDMCKIPKFWDDVLTNKANLVLNYHDFKAFRKQATTGPAESSTSSKKHRYQDVLDAINNLEAKIDHQDDRTHRHLHKLDSQMSELVEEVKGFKDQVQHLGPPRKKLQVHKK